MHQASMTEFVVCPNCGLTYSVKDHESCSHCRFTISIEEWASDPHSAFWKLQINLVNAPSDRTLRASISQAIPLPLLQSDLPSLPRLQSCCFCSSLLLWLPSRHMFGFSYQLKRIAWQNTFSCQKIPNCRMDEETNPVKEFLFAYIEGSQTIPRLIAEKKFDEIILGWPKTEK